MLLGLESCGQLGLRPLRPFTDGNDWWVVQRGRLAPIMFSVRYKYQLKPSTKRISVTATRQNGRKIKEYNARTSKAY
jgi:hypothetical protein